MEYYDYGSTDGRVTYIPSSTNGRSQKRNRMAVSNPKPSLSLVGTRSSNQGKLWLSLPFCPSTPMHRVLNPVHYGQSLDPTPIGGASLGNMQKSPTFQSQTAAYQIGGQLTRRYSDLSDSATSVLGPFPTRESRLLALRPMDRQRSNDLLLFYCPGKPFIPSSVTKKSKG